MSDKFIGFHRLIEACDEAGCPACRCLDADTHRYLTAFLYEHVTDPVSRSRLRASWGLCNWHAWMLRETADPAFGSAILCEDLLRVVGQRLERAASRAATRPATLLGRLRARLGRARAPAIARIYRRRILCPACSELAHAEERYLQTALRFVDDPQFERWVGQNISKGLRSNRFVRHRVLTREARPETGRDEQIVLEIELPPAGPPPSPRSSREHERPEERCPACRPNLRR